MARRIAPSAVVDNGPSASLRSEPHSARASTTSGDGSGRVRKANRTRTGAGPIRRKAKARAGTVRPARGGAAAARAAARVLVPAANAPRLSAQQSAVAQTLISQAEDLRKEKKEAEALETADRAIEAAKELGDRLNEADAARLSARILYSMGRYTESMKRAEAARGAAVALNDRSREAQALHGMGNAAWGLGTRADARRYFEQAIALYRDLRMTREALRAIHGLWLVSDVGPDTDVMLTQAIGKRSRPRTHLQRRGGFGGRRETGRSIRTLRRRVCAAAEVAAARRSGGDRPQLALVLTSIGRLYRAHGEVDLRPSSSIAAR